MNLTSEIKNSDTHIIHIYMTTGAVFSLSDDDAAQLTPSGITILRKESLEFLAFFFAVNVHAIYFVPREEE